MGVALLLHEIRFHSPDLKNNSEDSERELRSVILVQISSLKTAHHTHKSSATLQPIRTSSWIAMNP